MAVPYCGSGFCYGNAQKIERYCRELGKDPNTWILFEVSDRTCYCLCGVWIGGVVNTPVMVPGWTQIPISDVVQNQTKVLASGRNLVFLEHVVAMKAVSTAQNAKNFVYLTYTLGGGARQLVLPATRMVLLDDRRLVPAGKLQLGDRLTDHTRATIPIQSLVMGTYAGPLVDIATNTSPPDPNLNGHLLLLNGVVAGDQMTDQVSGSPASSLADKAFDARPWLGSFAWRQLHPGAKHDLRGPIEIDGGVFTPADCQAVVLPENRSD